MANLKDMLAKLKDADENVPYIECHLKDIVAEEGTTITFSARVTGLYPISSIWYKNGKEIPITSRLHYNSQSKRHRLAILDVRPTDCGVYSLVCRNNIGYASSQAILQVKCGENRDLHKVPQTTFLSMPPSGIYITQHLKDVRIKVGDPIILRVTISTQNSFNPQFVWLINGRTRKFNDEGTEITSTENSFSEYVKYNAEINDSGVYSALVIHEDIILSSSAEVVVMKPNFQHYEPMSNSRSPSFILPLPEVLDVYEGEEVSMTCKTTLDQNTEVFYFFREIQIVDKTNIKILQPMNRRVGISIEKVSTKDKGQYTILLQDKSNKNISYSHCMLNVKPVPSGSIPRATVMIPLKVAISSFGSRVCLYCRFKLPTKGLYHAVWRIGLYQVEYSTSKFRVVSMEDGFYLIFINMFEPDMAGEVSCQLRYLVAGHKSVQVGMTKALLVDLPQTSLQEDDLGTFSIMAEKKYMDIRADITISSLRPSRLSSAEKLEPSYGIGNKINNKDKTDVKIDSSDSGIPDSDEASPRPSNSSNENDDESNRYDEAAIELDTSKGSKQNVDKSNHHDVKVDASKDDKKSHDILNFQDESRDELSPSNDDNEHSGDDYDKTVPEPDTFNSYKEKDINNSRELKPSKRYEQEKNKPNDLDEIVVYQESSDENDIEYEDEDAKKYDGDDNAIQFVDKTVQQNNSIKEQNHNVPPGQESLTKSLPDTNVDFKYKPPSKSPTWIMAILRRWNSQQKNSCEVKSTPIQCEMTSTVSQILMEVIYCKLGKDEGHFLMMENHHNTYLVSDTMPRVLSELVLTNKDSGHKVRIIWDDKRDPELKHWYAIDMLMPSGQYCPLGVVSKSRIKVTSLEGQVIMLRVRIVDAVEHIAETSISISIRMQKIPSSSIPPHQPIEEFEKQFTKISEPIGKGAFGSVYIVQNQSGRFSAAKFVKATGARRRNSVQREISLMQFFDHERIVQLQASFCGPDEFVIVMEYLWGGELFERIFEEECLTEGTAVLYIRQICEGLEYLHKQSIVHLDIKPENIMCVSRHSRDIKIVDFGLSRAVRRCMLRTMYGTEGYIAPEVMSYNFITTATDMWSLGVVTYVMLSGTVPFEGGNWYSRFRHIQEGNYSFLDATLEDVSAEALDFISSLLVLEPHKRLTAVTARQHPWMLIDESCDKAFGQTMQWRKNMKNYLVNTRARWQAAPAFGAQIFALNHRLSKA